MNERDYFEQFTGDVDECEIKPFPFTLEEFTALNFDETESGVTWIPSKDSTTICSICKNK